MASYDAESRFPSRFIAPIDLEDPESLEIARGKLLSLVDTSRHEVITDVLVAGEVTRLKDGNFQFEHEWKDGNDPKLDIDQFVRIREMICG